MLKQVLFVIEQEKQETTGPIGFDHIINDILKAKQVAILGILKAISSDIEELVNEGFSDDYIEKSVGIDRCAIQYVIDYFRNEKKLSTKEKINTKSNT